MLNAAHLHLVINHIPVIIFPAGLLLFAYALITEDDRVQRLSMVIFAIVAVVTIPTYISGLQADHLIEELPGISEAQLDTHRDAAFRSMLLAEILGAFCLVVLMAYRMAPLLPRWTQGIALAIVFIVAGLMVYASYLGGNIRHPETLPNWKPPSVSN